MTWMVIQRNWKQHAPRVKERWDKLTSADIERIGGKRESLEARLRKAYGIERDDARKAVDAFCRSFRAR